jgi:hypothetical protein
MYMWAREGCQMKKNEVEKSRETVPLKTGNRMKLLAHQSVIPCDPGFESSISQACDGTEMASRDWQRNKK